MPQAIEFKVTVTRDGQAHTYQLTPAGTAGADRQGNPKFAQFAVPEGCPDISLIGKHAYVPLPKTAHTDKPTRKSQRASAKKHAPAPTAAPAGTPQSTSLTLADVQKLIAKGVAEALKAAK